MDWPSSSWLFIRVGAFFSSFSYTNSSSRTSATRKLNYQVIRLQWAKPRQAVRTVRPNSQPSPARKPNNFSVQPDLICSTCYLLSHHMIKHWQSQSTYQWYVIRQGEQIQYTMSNIFTHDCNQQLVSLCLMCYGSIASWCGLQRMHSWAYRLHRHPTNWCMSNTISEMFSISYVTPLAGRCVHRLNSGFFFWLTELLLSAAYIFCKNNTTHIKTQKLYISKYWVLRLKYW